MNCIQAALRDRGMTVADLSHKSGVPYTTLSAMVKGTSKVANMGIDRFLSVAHALNLSAEQLYHYCDGPVEEQDDPRLAEIEAVYLLVSDQGKDVMWTNAIMVRNTFSEYNGGNTVQAAI